MLHPPRPIKLKPPLSLVSMSSPLLILDLPRHGTERTRPLLLQFNLLHTIHTDRTRRPHGQTQRLLASLTRKADDLSNLHPRVLPLPLLLITNLTTSTYTRTATISSTARPTLRSSLTTRPSSRSLALPKPEQTLEVRDTPTHDSQMDLHRRPRPQLVALPRRIPRLPHDIMDPVHPDARSKDDQETKTKQHHENDTLVNGDMRPEESRERQGPDDKVRESSDNGVRHERRVLLDAVGAVGLDQAPVRGHGVALCEEQDEGAAVHGDDEDHGDFGQAAEPRVHGRQGEVGNQDGDFGEAGGHDEDGLRGHGDLAPMGDFGHG